MYATSITLLYTKAQFVCSVFMYHNTYRFQQLKNRQSRFAKATKIVTVKALLSPGGTYLISGLINEELIREGGLIERGGRAYFKSLKMCS